MGIVVTKDSLRPYNMVPQTRDDDGFTSINLEDPSTNGMYINRVPATTTKRWQEVFRGTKQHRLSSQRNGR